MCDMVNRNCFIGMSAAEQKEHFDEHGFLLLPAVLDADSVATVLAEMAQVTASRDSAGDWRGAFDYQGLDYGTQYDAAYGSWPPASVEQLICHPTILAATRNLYGNVKFFKGVFVHSLRRDDRQALHRDFDPLGQGGKDFRNSCDCWCNIGIYLRDQTPEEGPLWVVPGSNRLPRDIGRAGAGFDEHYAPQARRVCCRAGDAVIFDCLTIHAGGKHMEHDRPGCFHSYRAAQTVTNGETNSFGVIDCAETDIILL